MCKWATCIIYRCACIRCNFGDVLNPHHEGYFPHYGTTAVPPEKEPNLVVRVDDELLEDFHILVDKEDLCPFASVDEHGFWLTCTVAPTVDKIEDRFVKDQPGGPNSLCDECRNNCYRRLDGGGSDDVLSLLDQLSASSEGSPEDSQMGQDNQTDRERQLSMRERIYRNVLRILGYPENTPIPWDNDPVLRAQPPL